MEDIEVKFTIFYCLAVARGAIAFPPSREGGTPPPHRLPLKTET